MAWEYLLTNQHDARAMLIAGYLAEKIAGKTIVDLDCGHAPLLKYLPKTFKRYYGNDTLKERLPTYPGALFLPITDEEFVNGDFESVDVLVVMGMGGYELTKEKLESSTLTASILSMTLKYKPEIVIIECIKEFEPVIDKYIAPHISPFYTRRHSITISVSEGRIGTRVIHIYEADNSNPNK
jgi:hypothetical protein